MHWGSKRHQPIQPSPLIGIGDNQPGDRLQVDLTGQDDVKGGLVKGKKAVDVGIDVFRTNGDGTWIEQGGGNHGGQAVKVGVAMGGDYMHGVTF